MEGTSLGGELVRVSACLTVSPLITGGQAHTHTIEEQFCNKHLGSGSCNCTWVVDAIAAYSEPCVISFCLLRAFCTYELPVCDIFHAIGWDFMLVDELDCVGAFDYSSESLSQATKLVGCQYTLCFLVLQAAQ
jgi:hypothetical protein